jgi:hypothetical protein
MCIDKTFEIDSDKTIWNCYSFIIGTLLGDGYLNKYGALKKQSGAQPKTRGIRLFFFFFNMLNSRYVGY